MTCASAHLILFPAASQFGPVRSVFLLRLLLRVLDFVISCAINVPDFSSACSANSSASVWRELHTSVRTILFFFRSSISSCTAFLLRSCVAQCFFFPQAKDLAMSESGNMALKTSAKFSLLFREWCFSAVWRHHNTSARSVAMLPSATLMSAENEEAE